MFVFLFRVFFFVVVFKLYIFDQKENIRDKKRKTTTTMERKDVNDRRRNKEKKLIERKYRIL